MLVPGQFLITVKGSTFGFTGDLPRDRWVCIELHVAIDPAGFVELALDGGAAMRTATTDTTVTGGYTQADVGIHYATAAQTPAELWADEVVIDTIPIGCN